MSTAIEEHVNSTGVDNKKLMMWIFLGSDCLFLWLIYFYLSCLQK